MKKVFLTAITIAMLWGIKAFGMYGWSSLWIGFPTDPNQLRVRTDQLGFVLGNGTIKGTFGFKANRGILGYGNIFEVNSSSTSDQHNSESSFLNSTISAGLAYTSDAISVGVGYNFTYFDRFIQVHTPVLVLKVSDKFRMAIPIRVAAGKRYTANIGTNTSESLVSPQSATKTNDYLGVSIHSQFRIYPGIDLLRQIRLYVNYGMNKLADNSDKNYSITRQNFSFQLRIYQDYYVESVRLQPYLRIMFSTALNNNYGKSFNAQNSKYGTIGSYDGLSASSGWNNADTASWISGSSSDRNPWFFNIAIPLGIFANSDILSFYFMPELGLSITGNADKSVKEKYALSYGIYAEIYMTPIKNVEWYNELGMNGASDTAGITGIKWEVSSGITWYLPSLQNN